MSHMMKEFVLSATLAAAGSAYADEGKPMTARN